MLETVIRKKTYLLVWACIEVGTGHLVHEAFKWIPPEFLKKRRRPRMNWKKALDKDLRGVIDLI